MKVIVPAAGTGTRLRPHTYSQPKPLLHLAGKAMMAHILDPVLAIDPEEVVFVIGYKGDEIRKWVAANYDFPSKFIQQDNLLGLGYAVKLAIDEIESGPVLVVLSDTILECDLAEFVRAGDFVLGLKAVDDPTRFGVAEIDKGVIVGLEERPEKPKSNLAVIGLYYFEDPAPLKTALDELLCSGTTTHGEVQFTDALQIMIKQGANISPFEVNGWYDAGKKETLLETNETLVRKMGVLKPIEGSELIPPVFVAPDAEVLNSVLGPNVSVSSGTKIRNSTIKNSIIGYNSELTSVNLKDSLVGNDSRLTGAEGVYNVGDSSDIDCM